MRGTCTPSYASSANRSTHLVHSRLPPRASQAALTQYTMQLAAAWPQLRVNACSPGYVLTDLTAGMGATKRPDESTASCRDQGPAKARRRQSGATQAGGCPRLSPAPEDAPGCPKLRPASAVAVRAVPRWPAMPGVPHRHLPRGAAVPALRPATDPGGQRVVLWERRRAQPSQHLPRARRAGLH